VGKERNFKKEGGGEKKIRLHTPTPQESSFLWKERWQGNRRTVRFTGGLFEQHPKGGGDSKQEVERQDKYLGEATCLRKEREKKGSRAENKKRVRNGRL